MEKYNKNKINKFKNAIKQKDLALLKVSQKLRRHRKRRTGSVHHNHEEFPFITLKTSLLKFLESF